MKRWPARARAGIDAAEKSHCFFSVAESGGVGSVARPGGRDEGRSRPQMKASRRPGSRWSCPSTVEPAREVQPL